MAEISCALPYLSRLVRFADSISTIDAKAGQDLWEPLLLAPILSAPEIVIPSM